VCAFVVHVMYCDCKVEVQLLEIDMYSTLQIPTKQFVLLAC